MRVDYFVNLRCQTSAIKLQLGIKYSTCDLISDVNYFFMSRVVRYGSCTANYISPQSCFISFY